MRISDGSSDVCSSDLTRTPIDWAGYRPPRPRLLLQQAKDVCNTPDCDHRHHAATQFVKTLRDYPLAELREYIDWQPYFIAWEMKGRFPDLLNNPATSEAARKPWDETQAMQHGRASWRERGWQNV